MMFLYVLAAVAALITASTALPAPTTIVLPPPVNATRQAILAGMFEVAGPIGAEAAHIGDYYDGRRWFTIKTAPALAARFPQFNVLIYGRSESELFIESGEHYVIPYVLGRGEDDTGRGFFEVHLLDQAVFHLEGPAGFDNWGFAGNYDYLQKTKFLQFNSRDGGRCHR